MYKLFLTFSKLTSFFIGLCVLSNNVDAADLDCLVKPEMYIELSSPAPGVIDKLMVNKGDHIKTNQVLAELESSVELAKLNQAKFEASNMSEINNKQAQLAFAIRSRTRYDDLYQRGSLSKIEKDKADTEVTLAETELAQAKEAHKSAGLTYELAKAQLALKTIKSPIDGLVIDRYAMIGESVSEKAIMKLAKVDPLRVELVAPTEYFGLIKVGMEAKIRTERPINNTVNATVTVVDQLIDPASGSFSVRLSLPNPDDKLIAGVNCVATFPFETPTLSSSLPSNSSETNKPDNNSTH